jgi:hypothetical protein
VFDAAGEPQHARGDFLRGPGGRIAWLRLGGRLYRHVEAPPAPPPAGEEAARPMDVAPPAAVATPRLLTPT